MAGKDTKESLTNLTAPRSRELADRACRAGLDPATSTLLQICCAEQNLDPKRCTCLDLAAAKLGKAPGELTEEEALLFLGTHWVTEILE